MKKHTSAAALDELLGSLDGPGLKTLLVRLVDLNPDILHDALRHARLLAAKPGQAASKEDDKIARATLDPLPYIGKMRTHMRPASSRGYRDYEYFDEQSEIDMVIQEVSSLVEEARILVETGDARNAAVVLTAVTEEWLNGWTEFEDYGDSADEFFGELGWVWTNVVLSGDWTVEERSSWKGTLAAWNEEAAEGGVADAFDEAILAAEQGWDYPPLVHVLEGSASLPDELLIRNDPLIEARLTILEREKRYQECCNLAFASGQNVRHSRMLVELDKPSEAVEVGLKYFGSSSEAYSLATALDNHGFYPQALQIAAQVLQLEGLLENQATWVRNLAVKQGGTLLAVQAGIAGLRLGANLEDYLKLKSLAGDRWPDCRKALLDHYETSSAYDLEGRVDIYLHEQLFDAVLDIARSHAWNYHLVEQVVDGILPTHPAEAIPLCKGQAESIMDDGKAQIYHHAARWLQKAHDASILAGRRDEWQIYKNSLLQIHSRKYKLVPILKRL